MTDKIKILDGSEPAIDFLWESKILIASDSSIHLDAALTGNICFYYPSESVEYDYYGFLQHGIVRTYDFEEITKCPITRTDRERKSLNIYFANFDDILKGSKKLESYL